MSLFQHVYTRIAPRLDGNVGRVFTSKTDIVLDTHAFRARVLTKNELDMHRAHAKQGTDREQESGHIWNGGVTERRDGKYCRRKRGPYSEMLSGKMNEGEAPL